MVGFAIEAVFGLFGSKPVNIAINPVFLANAEYSLPLEVAGSYQGF